MGSVDFGPTVDGSYRLRGVARTAPILLVLLAGLGVIGCAPKEHPVVRATEIPLRQPAAGSPAQTFGWPIPEGEILSHFGVQRGSRRHSGLDIRGRHGQPVRATLGGRVTYTGSTMRGYGKTVVLDHGDGLSSLYAHNSAVLVRKGEWVERGQSIARVGRTGNASTEHCHFEIRRNNVPVDPLRYLQAATEGER